MKVRREYIKTTAEEDACADCGSPIYSGEYAFTFGAGIEIFCCRREAKSAMETDGYVGVNYE